MTNTGSLYGKSLYDLAASEDLSEMIMEEMEAVQGLFRIPGRPVDHPPPIRLRVPFGGVAAKACK